MCTKLPEVHRTPVDQAGIQQRDQQAKKMKDYTDRKAYVKPSHISKGDTVLFKRDPSPKKSTTLYDPKPYIVTECKGSIITAGQSDKRITRNSSFFKPVKKEVIVDTDEGDDPAPVIQPQGTQVSETPIEASETTRRYPQRSTRQPHAHLKDCVTT